MKKFQWLGLLMTAAILGVTGFQLFWLRQNYEREKQALQLRTNAAFRETVVRVQASKMKLDGALWNEQAERPVVKVLIDDRDKNVERDTLKFIPGQKVISTVNIIRDKMLDSLRKHPPKGGVVISMNKTMVNIHGRDTGNLPMPFQTTPNKDYILNLLYGVDSLQDSIRVQDLDSAYAVRLKKDELNIPFTITVADSIQKAEDKDRDYVTVGFAKPVTYQLSLGNSFPFLVRKIAMPILFSLLLLGITILSFVLLYRNMRKQERLAELKNEFISNITHELKTPIATVGVAIEVLKNFNAMDNPQRTREYLDISGNELQRLSLLVDKVLKLSMFEKKEIDLRYETLNLRELVQEVSSSLKLQLEKQHASLHILQEGDVTLPADRLHLLSVIFNLVDNALKYGGEQPEIRIVLTGNEQEVMMKIADNGIGIPAEYKEKIFEKFFRVPHGDTHNARGYGLGLSYAAQVIKKHQGSIRVESEEGKGAQFIIVLPKTIKV
jgi:two-component system, OmpR family, phosphate regulon sensor histidine kinase PhoR